jgi:NADP-dependent aldehyde dehydrogenase
VQLELLAAHVAAGEHHDAIIDRADPDWRPLPRPDLRRARVPLGPVVVFGASNFPLAFSTGGGDTGAALAAGCPVVVKGHPSHPGTGVLVAEVIAGAVADAGLPAGAFAHLLAGELDVAEALIDHPATAAVAFTGSFRAGRAILDRASARPKPIPVFAEMGSLNPVVVTAAALEARGAQIAEALAGAVGTFGGQLCTKPGHRLRARGSTLAADLAARWGAGRRRCSTKHPRGSARGSRVAGAGSASRRGRAADSRSGAAAEGRVLRGVHGVPRGLRTPRLRARRDDRRCARSASGPRSSCSSTRATTSCTSALARSAASSPRRLRRARASTRRSRPLVERLTQQAGRVIFDGVPTASR